MKRHLGWALFAVVLGAVACQTTNNTVAPPAGPETSGPANATPPVASSTPASPAEGTPVVANDTATPDSGAKMCGCSLCAPLPSGDACSTDADCAPSTPCHAPACVAKAKAIPRKPDQVCTMMMGCQTADANACTCWKGTCALTPRKP